MVSALSIRIPADRRNGDISSARRRAASIRVAVRRFGTTTGSDFTIKTVDTANGAPTANDGYQYARLFRADTGAYVPASSLTSNNALREQSSRSTSALQPALAVKASVCDCPLNGARRRRGAATRMCVSARIQTALRLTPQPNTSITQFGCDRVGHHTAAGCNGVAAYDVFRPNVPQNFTSGGPALDLL